MDYSFGLYGLYGLEYVMLVFFLITSVFFWIRYTNKNYDNKTEDVSAELSILETNMGYATLYEYDEGFMNLNLLTPSSGSTILNL